MWELSPDDLEHHVAQLEKLTSNDDDIVGLVEIFMDTFNPVVEEEK